MDRRCLVQGEGGHEGRDRLCAHCLHRDAEGGEWGRSRIKVQRKRRVIVSARLRTLQCVLAFFHLFWTHNLCMCYTNTSKQLKTHHFASAIEILWDWRDPYRLPSASLTFYEYVGIETDIIIRRPRGLRGFNTHQLCDLVVLEQGYRIVWVQVLALCVQTTNCPSINLSRSHLCRQTASLNS